MVYITDDFQERCLPFPGVPYWSVQCLSHEATGLTFNPDHPLLASAEDLWSVQVSQLGWDEPWWPVVSFYKPQVDPSPSSTSLKVNRPLTNTHFSCFPERGCKPWRSRLPV
jgi:hypothetical protein